MYEVKLQWRLRFRHGSTVGETVAMRVREATAIGGCGRARSRAVPSEKAIHLRASETDTDPGRAGADVSWSVCSANPSPNIIEDDVPCRWRVPET